MTDFERRLRAAMAAAAEPPPAGLLDGIRRRHRRHVRRVVTACVLAVAAAGIAVPLATRAILAGPAGLGSGPAAPGATRPGPSSVPAPAPTAVPGTVLRDCQNADNGTLSPDWKAHSIQAGPVWFIFARDSRSWPQSRRLAGGRVTDSAFVIAVANGRTAIVRDAPAAGGRFRFIATMSGSSAGGAFPPAGRPGGASAPQAGAPGLTLAGCPVVPVGTGIPASYAPGLTMFWQGYVNEAGSCVPLEVRVPPARQPIRVALGAGGGRKCAG